MRSPASRPSRRVNPTRPAGARRRPAVAEFEYRRHGTAVLFAALNVHDGDVAGWVTDSTRSENFVAFLADLVAQTPTGLELHCIVDNLSAHGTPHGRGVPRRAPHVFLHFTPTHASWLNQVELFFSILRTPTAPPRRVRLRRRPRRPHHRLHQGLQPPRRTIPLDLRRPPTQGRVTHNDLRASNLVTRVRGSWMKSASTGRRSPGGRRRQGGPPGEEDDAASGVQGRRIRHMTSDSGH